VRVHRTDIWDWDPTPSPAHIRDPIRDLISLSHGYKVTVNGSPNYLFEAHGQKFSILRRDQDTLQAHSSGNNNIAITGYFKEKVDFTRLFITLTSVEDGKPFISKFKRISEKYYQSTFSNIPNGSYKLLYGFSRM
jgi:hypothetical protein